jgi:transketolase
MDNYEQAVQTLRFLAIDAVEKADSGHPGTPMALSTAAVELFSEHLRYVPEVPDWPNRDRFVLSCGHASMLLYSILHLAGYDLPLDELKRFRQLGSKTPGHPEHGHTVGVETTTGPLGQGFTNAVGMALASKMAGARLNDEGAPLIDYRVYAFASDGDLMEGVSGEAASLAGHLALDNLIVLYDDNHITIDGKTELAFSEDVAARFAAYGWATQHIDGHDRSALNAAFKRAQGESKPSLIVARTTIAIGAPNKQGTSASHGSPLGKDEVRATKQAAGWPLEPEFLVPPTASDVFAPRLAENRRAYAAWQRAVAALPADRATRVKQVLTRQVPEDLYAQLCASLDKKVDATRSHSGKIIQKLAELVPGLVSGSADLNASTKTDVKATTSVQAGAYQGRNLHFGIREHAMGGIASGLALSGGFVPICSTFLVFADYMRPSIRLAALMGLPVAYVFTHDSIFVGEDGPTHQPIEQVWSLRLIPNLDVFRPADALECAAAWAHTVLRKDGPTALCLTRQNVPELERPAGFDPNSILRGAYLLVTDASPTLAIVATGSEVGVAVAAKKLLNDRGHQVSVVSAPCWDLFRRQPVEYQRTVLPKGLRVATVEAGVTTPWADAGSDSIRIGIDRFGSSGPYKELASAYGLTAEQVADSLLKELA